MKRKFRKIWRKEIRRITRNLGPGRRLRFLKHTYGVDEKNPTKTQLYNRKILVRQYILRNDLDSLEKLYIVTTPDN